MKVRLIWADSLKGVLMILVVLGHAIQYTLVGDKCESNHVWNYIYSFHMPAFMLKLVSSFIVIIAIAGPYLKSRYPELHRRLTHKSGKGS